MSKVIDFLRGAFIPGLTVFTVFVPSAMAYGLLANLSPQAGIYAGLGAMLVYFFIGSSKYMFTGPDASSAIMTALIVAPLLGGTSDPMLMLTYVGIFSLLVGAFLVIGGVLRLGFIADFISKAPLSGYLTGVALIVFQSQFGKILGIHTTSQSFFEGLAELFAKIGETHLLTLGIGVLSGIIIMLLKRYAPRVPFSLIVVALSIGGVYAFGWDTQGVEVVGLLPSGLPAIHVPEISLTAVQQLLPGAALMALMLFSDVLMTSRAFAVRNGETIDADREVIASGAGNILNGFIGGFPVGANGLYSAVSETNGGKSKFTALITVICTTIFLLFFVSSLEKLPTVVLAAIIIVSCLGLIEVHEIKRMYRFHKISFILYLITSISVILLGIVEAIALAVGLTLLILVYYLARSTGGLFVRKGSTIVLQRERREPIAEISPGVLGYKVDGIIFYANCERIASDVIALASMRDTLRAVLFDIRSNTFIDLTSLATLEQLAASLKRKNIRFIVISDHPNITDLMQRAGTASILGKENIVSSLTEAMNAAGNQAR
jgi:MFS superfamily sulfate permease-like transporter